MTTLKEKLAQLPKWRQRKIEKRRREFLEELKYGHLSKDAKLQKQLIEAITEGDDDSMTAILQEMVERRAARTSTKAFR